MGAGGGGRTFSLNFPPLLKTIKADLQKWKGGLFTWFGRIGILKMNVLPRLLYPLQTLPIAIPLSFLQQIRTIFGTFVLAGKGPRINRKILSLPKQFGGLGLPDPIRYHRAVHLARVTEWCRLKEPKPWVRIEQNAVDIPLAGLPWLGGNTPQSARSHPTIGPTVRLSRSTFSNPAISSLPSPLTPVIGNPKFTPGLEPPLYKLFLRARYNKCSQGRCLFGLPFKFTTL